MSDIPINPHTGRASSVTMTPGGIIDTLMFYANTSNHGTRIIDDGDGHFDKDESVVEIDGGARARALLVSIASTIPEIVGYVHEDGQRFMSREIFKAWTELRATATEAAQWKPVGWLR